MWQTGPRNIATFETVQADAMCDRLVHGAVRIDLGDVNVRKLFASKKESKG